MGYNGVDCNGDDLHLEIGQNEVEILTESPAGYAIFADLDGSLSGTTGGTRQPNRQRTDFM